MSSRRPRDRTNLHSWCESIGVYNAAPKANEKVIRYVLVAIRYGPARRPRGSLEIRISRATTTQSFAPRSLGSADSGAEHPTHRTQQLSRPLWGLDLRSSERKFLVRRG